MNFAEAVASLGETPQSIINALRERGVTGKKASACFCPVASYLKACGFQHVTVASRASRYDKGTDHDPAETILLPVGVRQWISDFDCGSYSEFQA